jgi:UDP-glucose 6-dehydrogenase
VERAARDIAETVTEGNKIVVEKSTVPVKAAESINIILAANKKPGVTYQVPILPKVTYKYWFTNICNLHILLFCYF